MSNTKLVRDAIAALDCPKYGDSIWITPFELLAGAGYALIEAERHGFVRRDQARYQYHTRVREKISGLISEQTFLQEPSDRAVFDDWVSGFYFNSATNRIVWAAERMVRVLACVDCPCGNPGELNCSSKAAFPEMWRVARRRLEHIANQHQEDLEYTHVLLEQIKPDRTTGREMIFTADAVLTMLQQDLRRKQSLEIRSAEQHYDGAERLTWSTAAPLLQLQSACAALSLLCHSYNELIAWQTAARVPALVPLGASA
jgi:hypothetical protein